MVSRWPHLLAPRVNAVFIRPHLRHCRHFPLIRRPPLGAHRAPNILLPLLCRLHMDQRSPSRVFFVRPRRSLFGSRSHVPRLSGSAAAFPSVGPSGGMGAELWVVEVLRMGYRLPFSSPPPLSQVLISLPSYSPSSIRGIALLEKDLALLAKGAIELTLSSLGFYSHLFVVWKTLESRRPAIDLSRLNEFVLQTRFKMESSQSVLSVIWRGD